MVRDQIRKRVLDVVEKEFGITAIPSFKIEATGSPEFGDYSTNVALVLAGTIKKPPLEIAERLKVLLAGEKSGVVVKVAPPGFINFYLSAGGVFLEFQDIFKERNKYGAGKRKRGKIQVEFVSANPTGPLTLANGRGGFFGDALANVLEFSGYRVEREYYVNDTGNQILTLGKSILAAWGVIPKQEEFYKAEYVKEWVRAHRKILKKYAKQPMQLGQRAARDFLKEIKRTLRLAGIYHNRFTSEKKDIHDKKLIKTVLRIFSKLGKTCEKDGALWLRTTDFGDDKDRVLVTSDGYPTYFLADSGHYLETKRRGFNSKINILGPDHYGYVKRIQAASGMVGLKNSRILVTQAIRLVFAGEERKMSKRRGDFVTFAELLQKVGGDVARYFFLERSPDSHIDFDIALAKERSAQNPVYYIQYAHARMQSILRKAKSQRSKVKSTNQSLKMNLVSTPEEQALIKKLLQFPEDVEDTAEDFAVHRLARYALELARIFHNFYEKHRVISADRETTNARLALVEAAQIVLKNNLTLLGIAAPAKM